MEIFFELPDSNPLWAPTPDEIARVVPAYTRGGFSDPVPQAGAPRGEFTSADSDSPTSPTLEHVESLIGDACREVTAQAGGEIQAGDFELARSTAKWWVAMQISAGKLSAQTDEAAGEYKTHTAQYLRSLEELQTQVRAPAAVRLV